MESIGENIIGWRSGRLLVIDNAGKKNGHPMVLCRCDCGRSYIVRKSNVKLGKSDHCGCMRKERAKSKGTHHACGTRIYREYRQMLGRCRARSGRDYKRYAMRGITVCDEWLGKNGFEKFRDWSFQNGYADSLTLDRIDNNGIYSPQNCRWTDWKTQQRNKETSVYVTYGGKTMCYAAWSEETGVKAKDIGRRIKAGWSIGEALGFEKRERHSTKR